jgi:hypothetical protein
MGKIPIVAANNRHFTHNVLQQRCCVKAKGSQEKKTRNSASGSGSTQSASLPCQLHNVKEPYLVDVLENEDGAVV